MNLSNREKMKNFAAEKYFCGYILWNLRQVLKRKNATLRPFEGFLGMFLQRGPNS